MNKKVGTVRIGKSKSKDFVYSHLRLPSDLEEWSGKRVNVYISEFGGNSIIVLNEGELYNQST